MQATAYGDIAAPPSADEAGVDRLLRAARRRLRRLAPGEVPAALAAGAVLVDIRSESQRRRDGEVAGAIVICRNVLEWRCDPSSSARDERVSDPSRRLILLCHEGCQSSLAAAVLQDLGHPEATDVIGGVRAWRACGILGAAMPGEKLELVRRSFRAFNERDVDVMLADWADDVEMRLVGGFAGLMGAEFSGHEGVRTWLEDWLGSVEVRAEIESIFEAGDQVVVIARATGAGGSSGAPAELRAAQIYSFRDGKVSAVANYYDPSEALKAVGLEAP
jgi:ketosteroid isomerase-like protein/rhodanese-related sulfurtransferase